MKWVLCDVIFLHRWWERSKILSCSRKDRVLIHQSMTVLDKIKSLICDVVTYYHVIARKRNRTIYPQERIFPSKFTRVLTHRNFFWWKKQEILSSCKKNSIIYISIHEAKLMIIKINCFICDVIQDLLSLQKLSQNIQDYSHSGRTPEAQVADDYT